MGSAPRVSSLLLAAVLAVGAFLAVRPLSAQNEPEPPTPEQIASMERLRPLVNAIWADVRTPATSDDERPHYFWDITDKLIALGPEAIPFLTAEVELMDPETFHFAAYSLGRIGGKDAELSLRRAVRAADALGGRFGQACKRYALYGLALLGVPDVMDLLQQGQSLHGVDMIANYPMASQFARMIGTPAAPILTRQLETFRADPAAGDKLADTILALGQADDPSVVPKLVPFLSSTVPEIRARAADAVARLAEPSRCDSLVPLLAVADPRERGYVAGLFSRWKPQSCYQALVGRLESEDDVATRGALYSAIVAMGGEGALEVLRPYLKVKNQFDQYLVIDSIGEIGSPKGLNMLRAVLRDSADTFAIRALGSIARIGGDGALDTLLAATGDRRRAVAAAAQEILANLGNRQVAPRVASELLGVASEPVGNPALRATIARSAEALVTLRYTDPVDDVKAAAGVQVDSEIKESLASCARRLRLLADNGDDVTAWSSELAGSFPDVRRLAFRRLAEIGSASAVRAMTNHLKSASLTPDERGAALVAIGDARTERAMGIIEAHLADPTFDTPEFEGVRTAAAWAARRLGGKRMSKALTESAMRRDGRDWASLLYLAVLDKATAGDTLKTLRSRRLRYPDARFGQQATQLDAILADIAGGRSLSRYDVRPEPLMEG